MRLIHSYLQARRRRRRRHPRRAARLLGGPGRCSCATAAWPTRPPPRPARNRCWSSRHEHADLRPPGAPVREPVDPRRAPAGPARAVRAGRLRLAAPRVEAAGPHRRADRGRDRRDDPRHQRSPRPPPAPRTPASTAPRSTLIDPAREHPAPGRPTSPRSSKAYGPASVVDDQSLPTGQRRRRRPARPGPERPVHAGRCSSLDSGRYPTRAGQVAVTSGLAQLYGLQDRLRLARPCGAATAARRHGHRHRRGPVQPATTSSRWSHRASSPIPSQVRIFLGVSALSSAVSNGGAIIPASASVSYPQPSRQPVRPGRRGAGRLGARPGLHRAGGLGRVHRHGAAQAASARHALLARRDRGRRPVRADHGRRDRRPARRGRRRRDRVRRAGSGTTRTWRSPPRTAPTRSTCRGRRWSSA